MLKVVVFLNSSFLPLQLENMTTTQMMRGTATYMLDDGQQDKLDFKMAFNASTLMVPENEGLPDLLAAGVLDHGSAVKKEFSASNSFEEALAKLSSEMNFAVVEQIDNTAYMYGKSLKGHHVAFLLKANGNQIMIEGKANEPSILAALTDEIRDLKL